MVIPKRLFTNKLVGIAQSDVIALSAIINRLIEGSSLQDIPPQSLTHDWCKSYVTFLEGRDRNLSTFENLIETKVLSKAMAEKAAASGLTYRHFQIAYRRDGDSGLKAVLGEKFGDKIRVTRTSRIISSLVGHFESKNL